MAAEQWFIDAEVLLRKVALLTEERDHYALRFRELGIDYEHAVARIEQLEHANEVLRIELYGLKSQKPDKRRVGTIVSAIAGVALGLVSGVGQGAGTELYNELRGLQDQAIIVAINCDVPPSAIPGAPQTISPPSIVSEQDTQRFAGITSGFSEPFSGGRRATRDAADSVDASDSASVGLSEEARVSVRESDRELEDSDTGHALEDEAVGGGAPEPETPPIGTGVADGLAPPASTYSDRYDDRY